MKSIISFNAVTFRIGSTTILPNTNWQIKEGQHWAILGPNGSGKSTLVKALWGGTSLQKGTIDWHFIENTNERLYEQLRENIGYVSFELQQNLVKEERKNADYRVYKGALHEFTSAGSLIRGSVENKKKIAAILQIGHLLQKDITTLSTGESRKILLARALVKEPRILILDEPFDGLDKESREKLQVTLSEILQNVNVSLILVTHRLEEILPEVTHVMMIKDGVVIEQGKKDKVLKSEKLKLLYEENIKIATPLDERDQNTSDEVVRMENISVSYGEKVVIKDFSWVLKAGEKWAVLGPNGSGKSTLIKLITGDHLQAYSNDIWLFGKKRGTGESIWDIKKRIGLISSDVQLHYLRNITGLDVILSGLFDSYGLYQRASYEQIEQGQLLADKLGVCQLLTKSYLDCSNGQKRMLILARALIKQPELLILDEPCQGLDLSNRMQVLKILNYLTKTNITIIYVTHHKEEIISGFNNVLELKNNVVNS